MSKLILALGTALLKVIYLYVSKTQKLKLTYREYNIFSFCYK